MFLVFGLVLVLTAVKIPRRRLRRRPPGGREQDPQRPVRAQVHAGHRGVRRAADARADGGRALTPFALVVVAVLATDVVFAIDSVPAVYGITADPYLVFVTNAFALLGLRRSTSSSQGAPKLVHLG